MASFYSSDITDNYLSRFPKIFNFKITIHKNLGENYENKPENWRVFTREYLQVR